MNNFIKSKSTIILSIAFALGLGSCTKVETDDNFPEGGAPAVAGGFTNSSEVAPGNLIAYFPFENSIADVKNGVTGGVASGTSSFVTGRKGLAYKGSSNAFINYANPGPVATLTSFTISMWINTTRHDGGAMGLFALAKQDGSFWGNFFLFIEGQNPATPQEMFMKLHFEKNKGQKLLITGYATSAEKKYISISKFRFCTCRCHQKFFCI